MNQIKGRMSGKRLEIWLMVPHGAKPKNDCRLIESFTIRAVSQSARG